MGGPFAVFWGNQALWSPKFLGSLLARRFPWFWDRKSFFRFYAGLGKSRLSQLFLLRLSPGQKRLFVQQRWGFTFWGSTFLREVFLGVFFVNLGGSRDRGSFSNSFQNGGIFLGIRKDRPSKSSLGEVPFVVNWKVWVSSFGNLFISVYCSSGKGRGILPRCLLRD